MDETNKQNHDHAEIIERIRGIVRLMRHGATEGERQAAAAAASRIAKKAGIDLSAITETDCAAKATDDCDGKKYVKHALETDYITPILRNHFAVILVRFGVTDNQSLVTYRFVGTKVNIDIARHVFEILMRESRASWRSTKKAFLYAQEIMKQGIGTKGADNIAGVTKRAFYDGWFFEINRRLAETPLRNDLDQFNAERLAAEARFEKLKKQLNITESSSKSEHSDLASIFLGMNAAENVGLFRPCTDKSSSANAVRNPVIATLPHPKTINRRKGKPRS